MKSAKIKLTEDMEIKDLKKFSIAVSIGFIIMSFLFNGVLMLCKMPYYNLSPILLVLSLVLGIVIIILSFNEKKLYMTFHSAVPILGIIAVLPFYLVEVNNLTPVSTITKALLFLNYIFIDIYFLYKRILVKNEDYISSVKQGTHVKYIKKDLIVTLSITVIVLAIAKMLDSCPIIIEKGEFDTFIAGILGIVITMLLNVLCIIGFANYLYNVRDKISHKKF